MKAHTQQPAQKHKVAPQQPKDITLVLGWLLLPVVLVCAVIYKWRTMRANMGYRKVQYDGR